MILPNNHRPKSHPIAQKFSPLERRVVDEMNQVRANPASYIPIIQAWRKKFKPNGMTIEVKPRVFLETKEGLPALDEAIAFLEKASAVGTLSLSLGLSQAAKEHVQAQGPTGETGHGKGRGETRARIERYGNWSGTIGENITYGSPTAQNIVMNLIIDDGVSDRGHRINIFNPKFHVTGVAFGYHKGYNNICVITYATEFNSLW